jgi:hypothetical protein
MQPQIVVLNVLGWKALDAESWVRRKDAILDRCVQTDDQRAEVLLIVFAAISPASTLSA